MTNSVSPFCVFLLAKVTGEGWSSTSLIRNVSARLRSSNHMLPTDFPQSRAHPRVTYRRIFPLLLLLSAVISRYSKREGCGVSIRGAISRYLGIQTKISQIATKYDGIRHRERKKLQNCAVDLLSFRPRYTSWLNLLECTIIKNYFLYSYNISLLKLLSLKKKILNWCMHSCIFFVLIYLWIFSKGLKELITQFAFESRLCRFDSIWLLKFIQRWMLLNIKKCLLRKRAIRLRKFV